MNVKILLTPLIIVIAIIFAIWFVYPAYSNGVDGVKEKYAQLKSEESKFSGLESKSQNAEKLFSEISSLGADKDILYQFIPEAAKEEEVLDNINYLASASGVSISKFSISQPSANNQLMEDTNPDGSSSAPSFSLPKNIKASINLAGNYENIKSFLNKVDKFERYENFSKLQISQNLENSADGAAVLSDVLNVSADVDFNFLEKTNLSESNANDPVFSSDKLDLSAITEIKNKKTTEVLKLDAGQRGKANPFMP